jgi:hypothetical protein
MKLKGVDAGKSMTIRDFSDLRPVETTTIRAKTRPPGSSIKDQVRRRLPKLEIQASSLLAVRRLGCGSFGVVELMKNSRRELFAVKIFQRWHMADEVL